MKIPVLKRKDKFYIELPSELKEEELNSLELIQLKEGYYLLSTRLSSTNETKKEKKKEEKRGASPAEVKSKTSQEITLEEELGIVSRLLSLKFSERTPTRVKKLLTAGEKEIFDSLIKKKHVWVFKGKKYPGEGVYNISNKLFALWKESKSKKPSASSYLPSLQKDGFMIIDDMQNAKKFSEEIKQQMALGQVLGVRGFDGKYYIATKRYFSALRKEILKKMNNDQPLAEISNVCNAPLDACQVVLKLMAEEGEVIEKRKGVFTLVK